MKIERFEVPGLAQYSYVISADGKAAVIDAMRDVDRYLQYVAREGLKLTHVLETHIHADFAAGSTALVAATGAKLALSGYDQGEHYQYSMPHDSLSNGDTIEIGTVPLKVLYTPGHTPEHLSFVAIDSERSKTEPAAIFSGDFLFVGSLGRPDLLGEEAKQGLAHQLYQSLHVSLASIPDGVQVYPGHGAGSLCGSGMSERSESTVGYERATNHLFRLDEEDFVREIVASVPPMPSYYPRMKALNAQGAPILNVIPGAVALSSKDFEEVASTPDVDVVDLRRPESFGGAHIPGAINIGAGQNLSLWAGWMLDPGKRIVLVDDKGDDEASRRALIRVGLDNIHGYLQRGMPAWIDAGLDFVRTTQLSTGEVLNRETAALVVDVRSDTEWASGHIEGARHIMLGDLPKKGAELPPNTALITVCGSGYRSSLAASLIAQLGFSVSSMDGGMTAWNQQQLPTVKHPMGIPTDNSGSREHWNRIYSTKAAKELSWHEDEPSLSLDLIGRYVAPQSSIVDVGGGSSMLVPLSVRNGFGPGTIVDLSEAALQQVRNRLDPSEGDLITFRAENILEAVDLGQFELWHDRAFFHFLTDAKDRARYVELATQTVRPGGHLILGIFALDGPERCSGLSVCRYDTAGIAQLFANSFRVLDSVDHLHKTPWGVDQRFLFTVFSRNADELENR